MPVYECLPAWFNASMRFVAVEYRQLSLMMLLGQGLHSLPVLQVSAQVGASTGSCPSWCCWGRACTRCRRCKSRRRWGPAGQAPRPRMRPSRQLRAAGRPGAGARRHPGAAPPHRHAASAHTAAVLLAPTPTRLQGKRYRYAGRHRLAPMLAFVSRATVSLRWRLLVRPPCPTALPASRRCCASRCPSHAATWLMRQPSARAAAVQWAGPWGAGSGLHEPPARPRRQPRLRAGNRTCACACRACARWRLRMRPRPALPIRAAVATGPATVRMGRRQPRSWQRRSMGRCTMRASRSWWVLLLAPGGGGRGCCKGGPA
jgi:hypothetical protein